MMYPSDVTTANSPANRRRLRQPQTPAIHDDAAGAVKKALLTLGAPVANYVADNPERATLGGSGQIIIESCLLVMTKAGGRASASHT